MSHPTRTSMKRRLPTMRMRSSTIPRSIGCPMSMGLIGQIREDLPAEIIQEFMQAVCVNLLEHLLNTDAQMSVDRQVEIFWGLIGNGIGAKEQTR